MLAVFSRGSRVQVIPQVLRRTLRKAPLMHSTAAPHCIHTKMNPIRFPCIAALLALSVSVSAEAQTPAKKSQPKPLATKPIESAPPLPAKPPSPSVPLPFSPVYFNPGESPVAYLVNDPQKVYAWIEAQTSSIPGKPDQYSTTEERHRYEVAITERMKTIQPIPLVGACQKKYDPDRQSFEVKVLLSSIKDYSLKSPNPEALNLRRLTLAQANVQRDTYTAQNAYGATTEISRTISDDYVLAFPAGASNEPSSVLTSGNTSSSTRLPYRYIFNFLSLSAKLPPAEARDTDKQIACMYIFSLEPPYTFKFKEREAPTRDLPFERTANGFALFGRLDQVAVINKVSGEVYDQAARSK